MKREPRSGRIGFAMETLFQDVRYGARSLLRQAGYTLTVIIILALGIGANTSIFSVLNNIFFRPLPLSDSERLVRVHDSVKDPSGHRVLFNLTARNILRIKERNRAFSGLSAQEIENMTLAVGENPERITVVMTASGSWKTLGVRPLIGRLFSAGEEHDGSASRAAIISYSFWQHHFGGSKSIGETIRLNNQSYQVIGVLPSGFNFPYDAQVWIPTTLDPAARTNYGVFARLSEGVTVGQARAQMDSLGRQLSAEYADITPGYSIDVMPLRESLIENQGRNAMTLLVVVSFLLLLACANVANLTLARSMSRQRELALRVALGATRRRIAKQLMTESFLLSITGTIVGLLLTIWLGRYLVTLIPSNLSQQLGLAAPNLDSRMAAFTSFAAILTATLSGLLPALRCSNPDLQASLKEGDKASHGPGSRRILNAFVASEISMAFILLAGAAMMFENLRGLGRKSLGFNMQNLLTMRMTLNTEHYPDGPRRTEFVHQMLEEVNRVPGVQTAAVTTINPLAGASSTRPVIVEGMEASNASYEVNHRLISPGLFRAMGIQLLKGRDVTEQDSDNAPRVAVISESMARRLWPNQEPLDKRIRINRENEPWLTVVGVVADLRENAQIPETWYLPYAQESFIPDAANVQLMVRGATDTDHLVESIKKAIWIVDRNLPMYDVSTMEKVRSETLSQDRLGTTTVTLFAVFGLILAAVGIYALMSFVISQRIREIAIRLALGAQKSDVLEILFIDGAKLVLLGLTIGAAGAFILTREMSSLLLEAKSPNAAAFVGTSLALSLIALAACLLPARKAIRIDPVTALKSQ